jgi:hypothetical protein
MNYGFMRFISIVGLMILLTGCGGVAPVAISTNANTVTGTTLTVSPTAIPTLVSSSTPDACSPDQIEAAVQKVHRHMREFDDASTLASNLPLQDLSDPIANLQRIRREAEDEEIPPCLTNLKKYQIDHMNTVIGTLVAFLGGADKQTLEQNITLARQQHDQYTLELARLLGLTIVPATAIATDTPAGSATVSPTATP